MLKYIVAALCGIVVAGAAWGMGTEPVIAGVVGILVAACILALAGDYAEEKRLER